MPGPQLARRSSRSSACQLSYRSGRIEKPRSNHNSPRPIARRQTTSGAKRYATLDDHYNLMMGITGDDEPETYTQPTRPVSWHPSTLAHGGGQAAPFHTQASNSNWSRHSTYDPGFFPLSTGTPAEASPYISAYTSPHEQHRGSQDSELSWQSHTHSYATSSFSTPITESMPWYLEDYSQRHEVEASQNFFDSSDFLPIQRPLEEDPVGDCGKELVGMGLYDSPEPATSGNHVGTGKGLKLEETWQPPEEDEDDEEADDASSEDGSIDELPAAKEAPHLVMPAVKPQISPNMDGQSFFFDDDENYPTKWWYHQPRQSFEPVQDAGVAGWL
ncbi:hypothetical protein M011DRAFT_495996 [Sporormia fimetaria CBS 119925]|uniref:Uncharacterized protein n=1 Tax=Sporormia fimetaria CBS 119925 TaxID=1340428 RepID=A0A6A6V6T1_9PLEO|nr:hypothetical protein M011DRAFT_495996 [Sporormia fimetaria CBS 119925]